MVIVDIKKRNRDYGIITWAYSQDFDVMTLFNKSERLDFNFQGKLFKGKKISYKYRRISIGKKRLESIKEYNKLSLEKKDEVVFIKPYR